MNYKYFSTKKLNEISVLLEETLPNTKERFLMIDHNSVQHELETLANVVEQRDHAGANRLRLLSTAIGGKDIDVWADSDIYKIIDPDSIVEQLKNLQVTDRILTIILLTRNILIIAPIIITGYSISQAAVRYMELIKVHPNQISQPFLLLWENGFDSTIPTFLTLSSIALVDTIISVLIFLLTLVISVLRTQSIRREREAQILHKNLFHALGGASFCLNQLQQQRKSLGPLTSGNNLETAARQLDNMTRQVTAQFNVMTEQVIYQFDKMIKTGIDQLINERSRNNELLARREKELDSLNIFISTIERFSQEMKASMDRYGQTNVSLDTNVINLIVLANDLSKQQNILSTDVRETVYLLQDCVKNQLNLTQEQQKWGTEIIDTLDSLTLSVQSTTELISTIKIFSSQQISFFERLEQEREAQGTLAMLMHDTADSIKDAFASMDTSAVSMRSISLEMHNLLDLQSTLPKTMNEALQNSLRPLESLPETMSEAIQSYSRTARAIEKSCRSLDESSIAVYNASQELKNVISDLEKRLK